MGVCAAVVAAEVGDRLVARGAHFGACRVSGDGTPEQKWARVADEVARLTAAGAVALQEVTGHHVVMADPEGNEFCVA